MSRPLRVFLCHSSHDKPAVRALYKRLKAEGWIDPWLDEEKLLPGQDWDLAIEKAVEDSHAVIACISNHSVTKEGYIQKELRFILDIALTKPEEEIFVIPLRLEDCQPPRRLRVFHYVDYFPKAQQDSAYQFVLRSLKRRAESLGIEAVDERARAEASERQQAEERARKELAERIQQEAREKVQREMEDRLRAEAEERARKEFEAQQARVREEKKPDRLTLSNGMEFLRVPAGAFLMGSADDDKLAYDDEKPQHSVEMPYDYWMARFPVTNALYNAYIEAKGMKHPVRDWEGKKDHPVVNVNWKDAMAYCRWLEDVMRAELPPGLVLRLPSEAEWEKAARGSNGRIYPWGNQFDPNKCNTREGGKGGTMPVGAYSPRGDSPYGCADMSGNVWEWTRSVKKAYPYKAEDGREDEKTTESRVLRGGSFDNYLRNARCAIRSWLGPLYFNRDDGFRVVVSPILSL